MSNMRVKSLTFLSSGAGQMNYSGFLIPELTGPVKEEAPTSLPLHLTDLGHIIRLLSAIRTQASSPCDVKKG